MLNREAEKIFQKMAVGTHFPVVLKNTYSLRYQILGNLHYYIQ